MKPRNILPLAVVALSAATACNHKPDEAPKPDTSVVFNSYTAQLTHQIVTEANEWESPDTIVFTDSISLMMPERALGRDLSDLRDSITRIAFNATGSNIDSLILSFAKNDVSQYGTIQRRVSTVPINRALGYTLIQGSVVNLNETMLVYEVAGAYGMIQLPHGGHWRNYLNYMLDGSGLLTLDKLFDIKKEDALVKAIAQRADDMSEVIGPTEITSLPTNNNFYVNTRGEIVFVYQEYEVASYAQGIIQVSLDPYELSDYMTPYGVKVFQLQDLE